MVTTQSKFDDAANIHFRVSKQKVNTSGTWIMRPTQNPVRSGVTNLLPLDTAEPHRLAYRVLRLPKYQS